MHAYAYAYAYADGEITDQESLLLFKSSVSPQEIFNTSFDMWTNLTLPCNFSNIFNDTMYIWDGIRCDPYTFRVIAVVFPSVGMQSTEFPISLTNLDQLISLELHNNLLSGTLPTELGILYNLRYLFLYSNQFYGTVPTELSQLLVLQDFYLSKNNLNGTLSSVITTLPNLNILLLDGNVFTGPLPINYSYNTISNIDISSNYFSGLLPSQLGLLSLMVSLQVDVNSFTGSIPSELGLLTLLKAFHLHVNRFTSSLPSQLGSLTNLKSLMIFSNYFIGTLPVGFANFDILRVFYAHDNSLSGIIPLEWDNYDSLQFMSISDSGLDCSLPVKCNMSLLLYKGLPNTLLITVQPASHYLNSGYITSSLETWCISSSCFYINVLPNIVVQVIVTPEDDVLEGSLLGSSAQSLNGFVYFDAIRFYGRPNTTFTLFFSSFGINGVNSTTVFVPACEVLRLNSIQDPFDKFLCSCPPGYFLSSDQNSCIQCPLNFYMDHINLEFTCIPCGNATDPYKATKNEGSTSYSDCASISCLPDYFPSINGSSCNHCSSVRKKYRKGIQSCNGGLRNSVIDSSGKTSINIYAGHWLTTNSTYFSSSNDYWFAVFPCPLSYACTGGFQLEKCRNGYEGPACGSCSKGFQRLGDSCSKCPKESYWNHLLFVSLLSLVVIWCSLIVYSATHVVTKAKPAVSSENNNSIKWWKVWKKPFAIAIARHLRVNKNGMKIAVNHLQLIGFTAEVAVSWPVELLRAATLPSSMSMMSSTSRSIGLDCAVHMGMGDKLILTIISPIMCAVAVGIFYTLRFYFHKCKKCNNNNDSMGRSQSGETRAKERLLTKIKTGVFALSYSWFPGVFQGLLKTTKCYAVGDKSFMLANPNISCHSDTHKYIVIGVVFYLFIYIVIFCSAIWHQFRRNGKTIKNIEMRHSKRQSLLQPEDQDNQDNSNQVVNQDENVGDSEMTILLFLTKGYRETRYFWDLATTMRQLFIAVICLFVPASFQIFSVVWILVIWIYVLENQRPYTSPLHNVLEQLSLTVNLFNITSGYLYFTDAMSARNGIIYAAFLIAINFIVLLILIFFIRNDEKSDGKDGNDIISPSEITLEIS